MPKAMQHVLSRCIPLNRDHIDTDQIIPARYLKVTSKEGLGQALFADWRYLEDGSPNFEFVLNQPQFAHGRILLAGQNFGCGSSREHAPWALADYGVEVVIASSFADIFKNNALKNGILPLVVEEALLAYLHQQVAANPQYTLAIDVAAQTLSFPMEAAKAPVPFEMNPFWKTCLLQGVDQIGYTLGFEDKIAAFEAANAQRLYPVG